MKIRILKAFLVFYLWLRMVNTYFSPLRANAGTTARTTLAATATTGRPRSTRATRTARTTSTSTVAAWTGTTTAVTTVGVSVLSQNSINLFNYLVYSGVARQNRAKRGKNFSRCQISSPYCHRRHPISMLYIFIRKVCSTLHTNAPVTLFTAISRLSS